MTGLPLLLLWATLAGAGEITVPAPEARSEGGTLTLAVPAPGTGGTQFRTRLQDGLTHRVRYTVEVRPAGGGDAILTEILTTEVVYDLWDEVFVVTHTEAGRARRVRVRTLDRVVALLERPRFKTSLPTSNLKDRYVASMVVEVDPVSEEVLNRTRQLLAPPVNDQESRAARGLLGSVARVFVNESSASDGAERFGYRTAPFTVAPAAPVTP